MRIEGEWNKVITLKPTSDKVVIVKYDHYRLLYLADRISGGADYHRYPQHAYNQEEGS